MEYLESDEQVFIAQALVDVLLKTREEPGIPLKRIADIIKTIFHQSEVDVLVGELTEHGTTRTKD